MNIKQWAGENRSAIKDILLISLAALALRIIVYLVYATLIGNDTPGYTKLAVALRDMNLGNPDLYNGYRTPGYSLFMVALGINMELIRIVQNMLGILTSVLVYLLARMRVARGWALAAGLLYGLSIHFIFYEAIIQTEALANFLMALICCLYASRIEKSDYSMGRATWIGLLCAYLTMVRPQYLPIFFILFFFDAVRIVRHSKMPFRRLLNLVPGTGVLLACVGGWILLNRILFGSPFFTTNSPGAMMTHTIRFANNAGPEWEEAGNIMVKWWNYYRAEVEKSGSTERVAAPAAKEIYALYNITNALDRNRLINRINRHLILQGPQDYIASVSLACFNFWRVSLIMYPECFRSERMLSVFQLLWLPNKLIWLGVHLVFFLTLLVRLPRWRTIYNDTLLVTLLAIVIIGGMAVSSIFGFSNSSRYALPTESLVLIATLYLLFMGKTMPRLPQTARPSSPSQPV